MDAGDESEESAARGRLRRLARRVDESAKWRSGKGTPSETKVFAVQ